MYMDMRYGTDAAFYPRRGRVPNTGGGFKQGNQSALVRKLPQLQTNSASALLMRVIDTNSKVQRSRFQMEMNFQASNSIANSRSKTSSNMRLDSSSYRPHTVNVSPTRNTKLLLFQSSFTLHAPTHLKGPESSSFEYEKKDAETQTVGGLIRQNFDSISQYSKWMKEEVDPFLDVRISLLLNSHFCLNNISLQTYFT